MPTDIEIFKEKVDDTAPSNFGFALDGARAYGFYLLQNPPPEGGGDPDPVTLDQIYETITEVLGAVDMEPGDGRINRTLPKAHPMFPWLFVNAISNLQGVGVPTLTSAPVQTVAPALPAYAHYPAWWFKLDFTPRPYVVLPDTRITVATDTWYEPGDNSGKPYLFADEWKRFTDFWFEPVQNFVSAQQGSMRLRTGGAGAPADFVFNAAPKMYLPDQVFRLVWYSVPYRYVLSPNSFLNRFIGQINQFEFRTSGKREFTFPPGSLLYLNYNPKRKVPPLQEVDYDGVISDSMLCDIEFTMLYTNRTATSPPAPTFRNSIAEQGHNCLPWLGDRRFYYATCDQQGVSAADQAPSWTSFPLPLLFTDPDTAQP